MTNLPYRWIAIAAGLGLVMVAPAGHSQRPTQPNRVATSGDAFATPVWSFDGRKIAYVRRNGTTSTTAVIVAETDGTDAREVFVGDFTYDVTWSPRNHELAVVDNVRVFHIALARGTARELGFGDDPSWAPTGDRLAVDDSIIGGSIDVMEADGSNRRALTAQRYHEAPAWSPEGSHIAFVFRVLKDGPGRIAVMRADGRRIRLLSGGGSSPAWSPDGRNIVFGIGSGLKVVDVRGQRRPRTLTAMGRAAVPRAPSWSADGTRILFWTEGRRADYVWVVRADGTGRRALAAGNNPAWSPDGTRILFADDRACGGRSMIFVMDADGRNQRQVTRCA